MDSSGNIRRIGPEEKAKPDEVDLTELEAKWLAGLNEHERREIAGPLSRMNRKQRRAGWIEVGLTKGYTCKRVAGKGTDSWTGKRVWDTNTLRPKRVFLKTVGAP
jgi:hypothetical protein